MGVALSVAVAGLFAVSSRASGADAAAGNAYVALGDSFSAGYGTPSDHVLSGEENMWCYRTSDAYPELLASAVPTLGDVRFAACSGAYTSDLFGYMPKSYGPLLIGSRPPQLDALSANTRLVTLTLGGNDLGFATVSQCWTTKGCDTTTTQPRVYGALAALAGTGTYEDDLQRPIASVANVLAAIRERAPQALILIAGYPILLGDATVCPGSAWIDAATADLNAVIRTAAEQAGANVRYVDVTSAFAGHGRCTADSWIGGDFHPNPVGQQAYASAFAAVLATSRPLER